MKKWYKFDKNKGSRQKRPATKKLVLVLVDPNVPDKPRGIGVGYMKNSAGDKQCPYFVIHGLFPPNGTVIAWCDCLPDGFIWPYELNRQ